MSEIFDQISDEMLQAPPAKYSRAETLALLTQIFTPVGPAENLLVEDLANVRTQIQQADSRRESLFVVQQITAAKLYGISSARESADLETLWNSDPGHFHSLMRQDVSFLNKHAKLWRNLVSVCEDPAAAPSTRLVAGILRVNAQPGPAGELDPDARDLLHLALALQKSPESFVRSLQSALGAEIPITNITLQLTDAAQARQGLLALAQNRLKQTEADLATASQRQAIAQSHFSQCHHAGKDHLESLKLIVTDIRQLQMRHDRTLRTLYFLQNSRLREAERAAARARREAEKAAEKARKEAEKLANPPAPKSGTGTTSGPNTNPAITASPERKSAVTTDFKLDDHIITKIYNDIVNELTQAETPVTQSPEDAKALEASLANGTLLNPRADQIRQVFSQWTDHELFDHSHRYRTTFRKLKNSFLVDRIKEIAAQEREARHDRLKITEQHQAG